MKDIYYIDVHPHQSRIMQKIDRIAFNVNKIKGITGNILIIITRIIGIE